ncbi:hypothetical protein [Micromonospora sp. NBS 11-29]|uniref:hypothetical protein n=1 Tax=Micromonospora sp. NBS 11-29 TaxID=1960879 RepID=UPI000B76E200|nr:hypothetical protein [Micromonospora sp. NBS 11-29]
MTAAGEARPAVGRWTRLRWALGLAVLTPFLAETVASSNTPALLFPILLPVYLLVYGLPALLVREAWVRGWIGWPGVVVLGLAYTMINEGLVAATWFKLAPGTGTVLTFTSTQALHVAGVNWAVAANLVVFHTLYSIVLPCVLVEALGTSARGRPWLGRLGLTVCGGLVLLVVLGSLGAKATARVCAGPAFASCAAGRRVTVLAVLALVALALVLPRRRLDPRYGRRRPTGGTLVAVGAGFTVAFLLSFFLLPLAGLPAWSVGTAALLLVVAGTVLVRWGRAPDWDLRAAVLLALGALLPSMLVALTKIAVGQPVAVLVAAVLLWRALRPSGAGSEMSLPYRTPARADP